MFKISDRLTQRECCVAVVSAAVSQYEGPDFEPQGGF